MKYLYEIWMKKFNAYIIFHFREYEGNIEGEENIVF
jgi:hypothetical protein